MPRRLTPKEHIDRTRAAFRASGLSAEEFNNRQVRNRKPRRSPAPTPDEIFNAGGRYEPKARKAMPRKKAASSPLPAPPTVKRARKRIKTVKLTGDPFSAIRKLTGAEKAKRTRHSKAVHRRATILRHEEFEGGDYHRNKPVAVVRRNQVRRETKKAGLPKGKQNYYAAKAYRYALNEPVKVQRTFGLTESGRKTRKKKSA